MLEAPSHYGEATHTGTSGFSVNWSTPRLVRSAPTASPILAKLPSLVDLRSDLLFSGRPRFYFLNTGTQTITVEDEDANSVDSLASNKWSAYSIKEVSGVKSWARVFGGTLNANMVSSTDRVSAVANVATAPTFDSFCLYENICEWLRGFDSVPLTGGGATEEVLAPFFQDVTVHAKNASREAVRAADCVMPSKIAVRFSDGDFTLDSLHPGAGTNPLSTYFFDALYRRSTGPGAEPHILEYDSATSPITEKTGNWHHTAHSGILALYPGFGGEWDTGPVAADLSAMKYVWKKTIPYGPPENPTAFTLEIRFMMEHTLGAAVRLDPEADGGPKADLFDDLNHEKGMWGALFTLAIFTDEVYVGFSDNSTTFQPLGWQGATTWRRSNPAIHGGAWQVVGTETLDTYAKRGVHPQCVALAHLPTTFHAPIGRTQGSWANKETYKSFSGESADFARNLSDCEIVPNGSPWLDTSACVIPCRQSTWPNAPYGIMENIVFGYPFGLGSYWVGKGMTLGGDMKKSRPMEWLCWENGTGNGLTLLKVAKPGWSEACGELDVAGGNSGEVWICVNDGDCPRGNAECGGDAGEWPVTLGMSCCDGHPAEPYMGVGGSHTCFRSTEGTQLNKDITLPTPTNPPNSGNYVCCTPPRDAVFSSYEYCIRTNSSFGDFNGVSCELLPTTITNTDTFWSQWVGFFTQYFMAPNYPANMRYMTWTRILPSPEPEYAMRNWTYSSSDPDLLDTLGTFTHGASSLTVTGVSGSSAIRAHCRYNKNEGSGGGFGGWEWFGCDIQCRFSGVSSVGPQGIGFLDTNQNGYGLNVVKSGSDMVMQVCRYSVGVKTVVLSETFTGAGSIDTGLARFRIHGTDILASYTPLGQPIKTITVSDGVEWMRQVLVSRTPDRLDPRYDSLSYFYPSFYTEHTGTGSVWDTFGTPTITDLVPKFLVHNAEMTPGGLDLTLDEKLMSGWGRCTGNSDNISRCGTVAAPPAGPTGENCNCTSWSESMARQTSVTHIGPSDLTSYQEFGGCSGVDKPCDPDNPWFEGNIQYHGGPSPGRCVCQATPCYSGGIPCPKAPPMESPFLLLSLPTDSECWDGAGDPNCVGSIPLLCYGIDSYLITASTCE